MRKARIGLEGKEAELIGQALMPEGAREIPRTNVEINVKDGEVTMDFEAKDTNSLRAAVNSYLRWATIASKIREEVKG